MLFSKVTFEDYYNEDKILSFYNLASKEFEDVELIWKYNSKEVDCFEKSNNVLITSGYKTIFIQNDRNNRGVLLLNNTEGKVKELLSIFKKSNIGVLPEIGNTYLKVGIFLALIVIVCLLKIDSRDKFIIIPIILSLMLIAGGIFLYIRSFNHFLDANFTLAKSSSIIIMIGLMLTAPVSILLISFILNINRTQFQKLLNKIE